MFDCKLKLNFSKIYSRSEFADDATLGIGNATRSEAMELGHAWVGANYTTASDGKTLVSADGLRQFKTPSFKPRLGITQANLEWRNIARGQWQGNGHLDITD